MYVPVTKPMTIFDEIESHPAWVGRLTGLEAQNILADLKLPFTYILREGENQTECEKDYYVTFVSSDLSIQHTPFRINYDGMAWSYDNTGAGGPYTKATIDDVIHLIMHCDKSECTPMSVGQ